jgi:transcriptional regulator with XRE-family HTH domain
MTGKAFNIAMGRVIREFRLQCSLTQKQVGAALGVSYQQINKYESGNNGLTALYLPALASIFGTTIADLYDRAGAVAPTIEPTEAENDSFLAARYVAKIADPALRRNVVDFTRKLAYQSGEAA